MSWNGGVFFMMNTQSSATKKVNVRRMTVIGVLSAISIMLSMIPGIGYIPIGPTNATIMHIPVIIGAIIEGPIVGATVGFIFGLTSLLKALTAPTVTSFAFMNPLVSILPRVLIGILTYYIYELVMKVTKRVYVSGLVAGALGSLVNTVGVLSMIYILYAGRFAEACGASASAAGKFIFTIGTTNGIPEAIVSALVVSAVVVSLKKVIKR
ncbi:ECF transporter S component [Romboutsia sp.]|uniref:ECF transporter S component n=1 Tax=Romboutsia sp. TaxID=1965302 RepID=UPI002F42678B